MRKFGTQLKGMGAKATKASKALKRLGDSFKRLADKAAAAGRRLRSAGAAIREAGTQMTFALGAPLALAIGFTVKAFAELELAMAGVQKTVGGTPAQLAAMKDEFIGLSNSIPIAATELAAIGQVAGQLGVERAEISKFTETIAKMGVATDLSTEQAAFALARISNIMGTPRDKANNLGSAIVDLGNNFAATESEIANFALRIAKSGKIVGLSEGELLGFSASLASVGVKAQAGGTAISKSFIKIANEVANGGAKVAEFARISGVSTEEFSRMFRDDAAGALTTFIEGLSRAHEAGENVFGTLEDLGLQEVRVRDAILGLGLAGDKLRESLVRGNKAFKENTALNREAEIFFAATSNQVKILWNQIKNAAAIMGEAFEPVIKRVIKSISEFAIKAQAWGEELKKLDPEMKKTIALVAGLVIAGGPALIFIGAFTQLIGFAWTGVLSFIGGLKKMTVFLLTNPFGLMLLTITALIALFVKFKDSLFTIGDDTARLRDYMVAIWEVIYQKIKWVGTNIVALFAWVGNSVGGMFDASMDKSITDLTTAFNVFKAIGNSIIQLFQIVGLAIGQTFRVVFDLVTDGFKRVWEDMVVGAQAAMKFMTLDFSGAIDTMMAPRTVTPLTNFKENLKRALDGASDILKSDPLGDKWKEVGKRAGGLYAEYLAKGFTESEATKKAAVEAMKQVEEELKDKTPKAVETFSKLFNKGFNLAFQKYIAGARDIAKQTEDAFASAFQGMEDGIMKFLETGKFGFKEFAKSIIADFARIGVKSLLGDVMSALGGGQPAEGGFGSAIGLGGALGAAGSGIKGLFSSPPEAAGSTSATLSADGAAVVGAIGIASEADVGFFAGLGTSLSGLGTTFMDGLSGLGTMLSGLWSSLAGLFGGGSGGSTGDYVSTGLSILSAFAASGGISDSLSKNGMVPAGSFANARHFAHGGVTSGTDRIPAMLSPNEAIIPLSRNRAVPIEGNLGGSTVINITVNATDVESFKQSRSQMLARAGSAMAKARRKTM